MAKMKSDIPLDQAIALVRACQKLNCDTAEQLFAMVERRAAEAAKAVELRAALAPFANWAMHPSEKPSLTDCNRAHRAWKK
jgi:hypothetical protein